MPFPGNITNRCSSDSGSENKNNSSSSDTSSGNTKSDGDCWRRRRSSNTGSRGGWEPSLPWVQPAPESLPLVPTQPRANLLQKAHPPRGGHIIICICRCHKKAPPRPGRHHHLHLPLPHRPHSPWSMSTMPSRRVIHLRPYWQAKGTAAIGALPPIRRRIWPLRDLPKGTAYTAAPKLVEV